MKEKLYRQVKCRKIKSAYHRFSSFHVTAECREVPELYDPVLWPAGSFVWHFYEKHRPGSTTGCLAWPRGSFQLREKQWSQGLCSWDQWGIDLHLRSKTKTKTGIILYNTRGLSGGHSAADRTRHLVVDTLLEECDILRHQETRLAQ